MTDTFPSSKQLQHSATKYNIILTLLPLQLLQRKSLDSRDLAPLSHGVQVATGRAL